MKGQYMFLLCLLLLFVLISLRLGTSATAISSSEEILREIYTKQANDAIAHSIEKTFIISANNKSYIERNFEDFVKYVKSSYTLGLLAVEANIPVVYANENTTFNLTVLNSLGKTIKDVSLNFSYDWNSYFFDELGDETSLKVQFTFNTSDDAAYQLEVRYDDVEDTVLIPVRINRSNFVYDVRFVFLNGQEVYIYGNLYN